MLILIWDEMVVVFCAHQHFRLHLRRTIYSETCECKLRTGMQTTMLYIPTKIRIALYIC